MSAKTKQKQGRPGLTKAQAETLKAGLAWRHDAGFDVEVIYGPTGEHPETRWRVRVSLGDTHSVILDQPKRGRIMCDTGSRERGGRPSTEESEINRAIRWAEEYLAQEQLDTLFNAKVEAAVSRADDTITVGHVVALADRTRLMTTKSWRSYVRSTKAAEACFGPAFPVAKLSDAKFAKAIEALEAGNSSYSNEKLEPSTAVGLMKDFVTVMAAVGQLENDAGDELHLLHPSLGRPRQKRFTWPEVTKERREAGHPEMYQWLISPIERVNDNGVHEVLPAPVDQADPTGALRLFIVLAYYCGRRLEAILRLRVEDYIQDREKIRKVLRQARKHSGICRSGWADSWRTCLNFRPEFDKEGNHFPVPLHTEAEAELDFYIARHNLSKGWLFPSPVKAGSPLSSNAISRAISWIGDSPAGSGLKMGRYEKAVLIASLYMEGIGENPCSIFPVEPREEFEEEWPEILRYKFWEGYKVHRFRGCHATEMERMEYGVAKLPNGTNGLNGHPSYIGSWAPADGSARGSRYVDLDGDVLQAVADWKPAREAFKVVASMAAQRASRGSDGAARSRAVLAKQARPAGDSGAAA